MSWTAMSNSKHLGSRQQPERKGLTASIRFGAELCVGSQVDADPTGCVCLLQDSVRLARSKKHLLQLCVSSMHGGTAYLCRCVKLVSLHDVCATLRARVHSRKVYEAEK